MNRRVFLKSAAAASLAGGVIASCAAPSDSETAEMASVERIDRLGVGLFTIPTWLEEDFAGSLARLAEIGYKELEFYGPFSFSVQSAHDRWNAITPSLPFSGSGYFGHTAKEVREIMDANGLTSPSMHVDLDTLENNLDALAEAAQTLGQTYAGIAAIPPELRQDLDGYKRTADRFNEIGRRMAPYGMKFLYHNHGYGLVEMGGEIPMQVLLDRTEPDLVVMEMDIYWTTAGRADPIAYLREYPGHYRLMHIKDMIEIKHFEGDGGRPEEWIALFGNMSDAGAGVLDTHGILTAARASGVDHFYLERDTAAEPEKTLVNSYNNLTALEFEKRVS